MHKLKIMKQQFPNTSEYSNEIREQVVRAMKVEQESSASKLNANTENCYRGSSTQLYFPAFPRRIPTTSTITKMLQIHRSTQLHNLKYNQSLSSQKTTSFLF